ncbi:MAG: hypothetical protein ACI4SK_06630 [Christensenellales bacterium]
MHSLFEITFPVTAGETEELYYRKKGNVSLERGRLRLADGAKVSFDAFFNLFSYSKFVRFGDIKEIITKFDLTGRFSIKLFLCDTDGNERLIEEKTVSDKAELFTDISSLGGEGFFYAELTAIGEGTINKGCYYTKEQGKNLKICIAICTYRREEFAVNNVKKLNAYFTGDEFLRDKFSVVLIDNGNTVGETEGCRVVPNKNLGGSGGFTRGLMEAAKGDFTHVLLMDDDVDFDCKIFRKLYSILSFAKDDELSVGGGMLVLNEPYLQYECGAVWKGRRLFANNANLDMRDKKSLATSEKELPVDYNAWWFMCMPVSFVEKYGLPFPFFIKGDDIEYGLRCCGSIAVMNGLAVWHESFDKKYGPTLEYYVKRNEAVINAVYRPSFGAKGEIKKLVLAVGNRLAYQRYYEVELIFRAYKDFLKGPDFFACDGEILNAELRSGAPVFISGEKLRAEGYDTSAIFEAQKSKGSFLRCVITLNGYLLPDCCYGEKNTRIVNMFTKRPSDFYKSKRTLQYDPVTDRGFFSVLDRKALFKAGFNLIGLSIRLLFSYRKLRREYVKKLPSVCSERAWLERLGIER